MQDLEAWRQLVVSLPCQLFAVWKVARHCLHSADADLFMTSYRYHLWNCAGLNSRRSKDVISYQLQRSYCHLLPCNSAIVSPMDMPGRSTEDSDTALQTRTLRKCNCHKQMWLSINNTATVWLRLAHLSLVLVLKIYLPRPCLHC